MPHRQRPGRAGGEGRLCLQTQAAVRLPGAPSAQVAPQTRPSGPPHQSSRQPRHGRRDPILYHAADHTAGLPWGVTTYFATEHTNVDGYFGGPDLTPLRVAGLLCRLQPAAPARQEAGFGPATRGSNRAPQPAILVPLLLFFFLLLLLILLLLVLLAISAVGTVDVHHHHYLLLLLHKHPHHHHRHTLPCAKGVVGHCAEHPAHLPCL